MFFALGLRTLIDVKTGEIAVRDPKFGKAGTPLLQVRGFEVSIERGLITPLLDDMDQAVIKHVKRIGIGQAPIFFA